MRYCEKCGCVMDEFDPFRDTQNCPICGGVWSEDDMTALRYAELSEAEKDAYDEQLLNTIKNSPIYEEDTADSCGITTEDGGFWSGFRVEKMIMLDPSLSKEDIDKILRDRKENEPFKPFPPIDTVKAREVAADAELEHIAIERGYYRSNSTAQSNVPKCPTCSSTNIQKIGGLERGASIAVFGLFSKKINKSFKCNNCGYTW